MSRRSAAPHASTGNVAIPLVAALTRNVAAADAEAKGYVHWGATSQDVIDTGLVLQLRDGLALIDADLARLAHSLASQARRHARTVLAGRTWLMQALPITLGVKLAAIVSALDRHRDRVARARRHDLVLQFGGAAGTLASLHDKGLAVTRRARGNGWRSTFPTCLGTPSAIACATSPRCSEC